MSRVGFINITPARVFQSNGYDLFYTAGNVGIGTSAPSNLLDVSGNVAINGNVNIDSGALFVNASNNRVGIGMTTPTVELDVSGYVSVNGNQLSVTSTDEVYRYDLGFNNNVYAIQYNASSNELFIGGGFTSCTVTKVHIATNTNVSSQNYNTNRIMSFSLTTGSVNTLGSGLNGVCFAIAISDKDVYVGGVFTDVSGIAAADYIARWNTTNSTWNALGCNMYQKT